jgi:hypothetical protein
VGQILWLDHSPRRTCLFSQRMSDEDRGKTHWVRTASEAIETLKRYGDVFSTIYLDHDLDDARGDSRSPESGMEVVRFLEKTRSKKAYRQAKIIVHSWNLPAARRMAARLRQAGFDAEQKPFGT